MSAPPPRECFLVLSIVHVLVGVTTAVLGVVAFVTRPWGHQFGAGLWIGLSFLWTGVTGLSCLRQPRQSRFFLFLVLSSVATLMAVVLITLAAVGLSWDQRSLIRRLEEHPDDQSHDAAFLVQCLLLVCATIEAAAGSASSVLSARWLCDSLQQCAQPNGAHLDDRPTLEAYPSSPFAEESLLGLPTPSPNSGEPDSSLLFEHCSAPDNALAPASSSSREVSTGLVYVVTSNGRQCQQPGTAPQRTLVPDTPPPSYSTLSMHMAGLGPSRQAANPGEETAQSWTDPNDTTEFDNHRLEVMRSASSLRRNSRRVHPARVNANAVEQHPPLANESPMSTIL